MFTIFLQTLKERRISLIVYCLASIGFMWMYISMFPAMQSKAEDFAKIMDAYPKEILSAMNVEELSFDRIEKFLAMEDFSMLWPLLAIFMGLSLAGGAIANDIEKGTAEIILARPVSRYKIYLGRYFAGFVSLLLFTFFSVFAIVPLAALHQVDYNLMHFVKLSILAFSFALTVFSLGLMCSALVSERSKVYLFIGGGLLFMYVLKIISSLQEKIADLKYVSFFYYYNQNSALIHNNLDLKALSIFITVCIISTIIGGIYFCKRDIAI